MNADSEEVATATPNALTDKNLYLYCDNNPINRVDNSGEFWNFVIGAAVGGITGAISTAVSGGDAKAIALSAGIGAVGGLIGASGLSAAIQIVAGGVLGGAGNFANQFFIEKTSIDNINWSDIIVDSVIGAGSSAIAYGATRKATEVAEGTIKNGINKIISGKKTYENTGRFGRGQIKKGIRILRNGIKSLNTSRGKSSVIGSSINGFVLSVKTFFKKDLGDFVEKINLLYFMEC